MSADEYQKNAEALFLELNKTGNEDIMKLFVDALESRIMKSAVEGGSCPTAGIGQWLGGQISICRELLDGLSLAPKDGKPQASGAPSIGFPDEL